MNKNAIIPNVYISLVSYCIKMHKASQFTKGDRNLSMLKDLVLITKLSDTLLNSVITNLFSIEIVYLFPEITVGVVK